MGKKLINESTLLGIADAIREQEGSEDSINVSDFAERILGIEGGIDISVVDFMTTSTSVAVRRLFNGRQMEHFLNTPPNFILIVKDTDELLQGTNMLYSVTALNSFDIYPFCITNGNGGGNSIPLINSWDDSFELDEQYVTFKNVGANNKSYLATNVNYKFIFMNI